MKKMSKFYLKVILLLPVMLFTCITAFCTVEPPVISGNIFNVVCNGAATGSITVTVRNGMSPFVFNWSNGASTASVANLVAGIYSVTVKDGLGIQASATFTVTQPAALSVEGGIIPTCGNLSTGEVDLFVSGGTPGPGGYSYKWSNGTSGQNAISLAAGTYLVTVTDSFACKVNQSFLITSSALPAVTPTATPSTICRGSSTTLAAHATAGGASISAYAWNSGLTGSVSGGVVTPGVSTTYIVTVTDRYRCTATGSVEVTVNATPAVPTITTSGSTALCRGEKVILTASLAKGDEYTWSTGATTRAITVKTAGTFSVTATNKALCSATSAKIAITFNKICPTDADAAGKTGNNGDGSDADAMAVLQNYAGLHVAVYPNPYTGSFHLTATGNSANNMQVKIYNITGQLIEERKDITYGSDVILGCNYPAGLYLIQVKQGENNQQIKVVKSE